MMTTITIKLFFFIILIVIYAWLLLLKPHLAPVKRHRSAVSLRCSMPSCVHKKTQRIETKTIMGGYKNVTRIPIPSFVEEMGDHMNIGTVNMEEEDLSKWATRRHRMTPIVFSRASLNLEWRDLFPEWIDEEEETDGPSCPEIPLPHFETYEPVDLVVAKVPCRRFEDGSRRDVDRLQMHLVTATTILEKGKVDDEGKLKVVILSKCRPMIEIFKCDDLVRVEGAWWFFMPPKWRIKEKLSLPVGSCQLALPLWLTGIDKTNNIFEEKEKKEEKVRRREAYATILHSSGAYVCGAITLGQSLITTGTTRDMVILMDKSIGKEERNAVVEAGWKIHNIQRIRNPNAKKNTYNEHNYSKLRLWNLTNYTKVIFIDADMVVLHNLDLLFHFPEMSAVGNDGTFFNSGLIVVEPSLSTFRLLMSLRRRVFSANGGDQGFLNEVFVWWHRLPRRVNLLKNFWSNSSIEVGLKNQLFASRNPPGVYTIHYLGLKPWLCYRDYDCNWDVFGNGMYASDVAHRAWWIVHDTMKSSLQRYCTLTHERKLQLEVNRDRARLSGLPGGHWNISVTDPRRFV